MVDASLELRSLHSQPPPRSNPALIAWPPLWGTRDRPPPPPPGALRVRVPPNPQQGRRLRAQWVTRPNASRVGAAVDGRLPCRSLSRVGIVISPGGYPAGSSAG